MDKETQTRIRDLILTMVLNDGSTIGNVSLFREVRQISEADGRVYDEDAVNAVREQLMRKACWARAGGEAARYIAAREYR